MKSVQKENIQESSYLISFISYSPFYPFWNKTNDVCSPFTFYGKTTQSRAEVESNSSFPSRYTDIKIQIRQIRQPLCCYTICPYANSQFLIFLFIFFSKMNQFYSINLFLRDNWTNFRHFNVF